MDEGLLLSIIIVNWNVRESLRDCLSSIEKEMLLPRGRYEVVVWDNASADGSAGMVREEFPAVRLTEYHENIGFGRANNRARETCSGEYILLLNPDTVVLDHALDTMLKVMDENPGIGALGCTLLNSDGSFQRVTGGAFPSISNVAWNYLFLNRLLPSCVAPAPLFLEKPTGKLTDLDWVSGAVMLLRRSAIEYGTIFDESYFMFGEDMDLCRVVRGRGWRVACTDSARIIHHHGMSYSKQTQIDILASAVKGPRQFFLKSHGWFACLLYDAALLAGYLIRWPGFRVMSWLRPGRGYDAMSAASRRYAHIVFRLRFS